GNTPKGKPLSLAPPKSDQGGSGDACGSVDRRRHARGRRRIPGEAKVFNLWVISDQHVGTDKAASTGILHGLVGFKPPPVYFETLAEALRQSENGGAFGGPPIPWDIALNLGDYAGFWDLPEDEQGKEVVRQYSVLTHH